MWVRMADDCAGCHYACKAIQVAQSHLSVTHSVCNSGRDQKSDDQRAHLRPAAAAAAADVSAAEDAAEVGAPAWAERKTALWFAFQEKQCWAWVVWPVPLMDWPLQSKVGW